VPHEEEHRDISSGGVRAAVFGIADGLVTNVSLILGFAGAHPSADVVRLAGLAGLVAGAFSMASGEYISMRAQRELFERDLRVERRALAEDPEMETEELVNNYVSKGMRPELARQVATDIMQNPELALEVHAREEFGVDPDSLGSPVISAVSSFLAFAVGAFIPLVPWLIGGGTAAVAWSIGLTAVALLTVGALLGSFTGRSKVFSALRSLGFAAVAAAVTYAIGHAVGAG
jgi:VIT1/CCC1 family predicted Fe2+/Mn2+ transporter